MSSPEASRVLAAVRAVVGSRSDTGTGSGAEAGAGSGGWWVGFSGGVDSTVLLDAAARVLGREARSRLVAVHVNHGLHPDAGEWEAHCRAAAARIGVRFEVRRASIRTDRGGQGLEAAARAARHAAFRDAVPPGEPVLLAHQRDDQVETVVLRLLRGAGPAGLAAMRPESVVGGLRFVRPLLGVPRSAILAYASERSLPWVEDPGNLADEHDRNHVRHRVVPALAARWPAAPATLAGLAERAHELSSLLDDVAAADLAAVRGTTPGTLSTSAVSALPPLRAANVLRVWLVSRHRIAPPTRRWLRVIVEEVAAARADGRPHVARGGIWLRRYRGELYTGRERTRPHLPASTAWGLDSGPLELPHGRLAARRTEGDGLAVTRLPRTVEVRFRQGGERCRPSGRGVTKPLKDLMQELAVPPWERGLRPLVFAGDGLAAVPGLFICDPYAARGKEPAWRIEWTPRRCD